MSINQKKGWDLEMKVKYFDIRRQNQLVKKEFLRLVDGIMDSGEICMGKLCYQFEEKWAEMNGVKYCVLVSSGTDALTLTIDALDVKGLTLTPSISFVATPNSISLNRQRVLFCEVDSNGNIDTLHAISKVSTQKHFDPVKAILAVGMYGGLPDMENLQKLAQSVNIPFILDGAQCHLATFNGKHPIDYCDAVTQSFYVSKNMSAIVESGCVLTNNKDLADKIRSLRNHGRVTNNEFDCIGYNSRPSEITAASLLVKLPFIGVWTHRRREIARLYNNGLAELVKNSKLRTLNPAENVKCVYHLFPVFVNGNRDKIRDRLLELGVETGCQYNKPLHLQTAYKDLNQGPFEIAENLCSSVITIPLYDQLSDDEVEFVLQKVNEVMNEQ